MTSLSKEDRFEIRSDEIQTHDVRFNNFERTDEDFFREYRARGDGDIFAALVSRLAALAAPFARRRSIAFSRSPSVSWRALLQSIIPAPVRSRSSFTCAALIAIVSQSVVSVSSFVTAFYGHLRREAEGKEPTASTPLAGRI